jgi:hypothetical protein
MKAEARDLTFLSTEGIVRIPFFQREYVWDEENWDELLTNLGTEGRSHFLGSLILKQQQTQSGAPKEVLVIDGQQRLTTLSVLLKALYDSLDDDARDNALNALRAVLFFKKSVFDKQFQVKIQHSHVDSSDFERVIRAGIDGPALDTAGDGGRVVACYRFFAAQLAGADWPAERRSALFAYLLDQQSKMLVVIDLAATDEEQVIFDTINSAGVRLSGADIVKNALYQRAIDAMGHEEAIALYDDTWKHVFVADREALDFWGAERLAGRLTRDNMEILLHAIAVIEGIYDPDKNVMTELASRYKDRIRRLETADAVRAFARDVHESATVYREHFGTFDSAHPYRWDEPVARLMQLLDAFQVSTLHPFILHAMRQPEERAQELLAQIERFIVRRVVAKGEMRSLNKLAKDLISRPELLRERELETTDALVSAGLRSISNKVAGVVLFWIELHRRCADPKYDLRHLPFGYTLEHVMPQKWKAHWPIATRKRADGSDIPSDELEADRREKVYSIGNMTLLTANLNSSLRNASFEKKIVGEGRMKGIREYATLTVTTEIVAEYDKDKTWDEAKIEARTIELERQFLAMWPAATTAPAA